MGEEMRTGECLFKDSALRSPQHSVMNSVPQGYVGERLLSVVTCSTHQAPLPYSGSGPVGLW